MPSLHLEKPVIGFFVLEVTLYPPHPCKILQVKGSRDERVKVTVSEMGPPVLNGAFSTLLSFILLAGSESHVFESFFKVSIFICLYFCIMVAFHETFVSFINVYKITTNSYFSIGTLLIYWHPKLHLVILSGSKKVLDHDLPVN